MTGLLGALKEASAVDILRTTILKPNPNCGLGALMAELQLTVSSEPFHAWDCVGEFRRVRGFGWESLGWGSLWPS